MKIQDQKIELQKKVDRKTCVTGITFLAERPRSVFWGGLPQPKSHINFDTKK